MARSSVAPHQLCAAPVSCSIYCPRAVAATAGLRAHAEHRRVKFNTNDKLMIFAIANGALDLDLDVVL